MAEHDTSGAERGGGLAVMQQHRAAGIAGAQGEAGFVRDGPEFIGFEDAGE
jgi:hypothetical protein